jgi:LacI family transcriptional regulator
MNKPTYSDIALNAGVGTATVERVLNGRGGVRPATVEKVVLAARKLDWPGRLPERHRGIIRIEIVLVRPDTSFYARLARAFKRISSSLDPSIHVHLTFLEEDEPKAIVDRIRKPKFHRSGLVIVSPDHVQISEALDFVQRGGLPIVQIVTRPNKNLEFVGINNLAAGRMAAMMTSRLGADQGTVVAMCHSQVYAVHRERIRGFSEYLAKNPAKGLKFEFVAFTQDSREDGADWVREAIQRWPDLAGVYNAGGGNSGVLIALQRMKPDVFFVGHELTETTREALFSGVADVIFDQVPEAQARRAMDLLLSRIGLLEEAVENPPIQFNTITSENA